MTNLTDRFFGHLFNEKDLVSLSTKTSASLTVATGAWVGSLCFPTKTGELCNLKSACFAVSILAGCAAIYFGIKREKPARKKAVLVAIEDNDFAERSGIVTGLNAEATAKHLEVCLKQEISPNSNRN